MEDYQFAERPGYNDPFGEDEEEKTNRRKRSVLLAFIVSGLLWALILQI